MDFLYTLIILFHILCAIAIIVLVLLQHGKGADMGAAFGSGASGSLFGATGSANFLSRATAVLAAVFFLTSLGLTYVASKRHAGGGSAGVMDAVKPAAEQKSDKPAADAVPPSTDPAKPATDAAKGASAPAKTGEGSDVPK